MRRDFTIANRAKRGIAAISLPVVTLLFGSVPKQLAQSASQRAGGANTQQTRVPASQGAQKRLAADSSVDDERQKALKARQTKALKRLNQLVDDSSLIGDAAARSRLLARVADALWSYDEARARSLFKDAFDEAIYVPKSDEQAGKRLTCGLVRIDVTRLLRQHDARFASEQVLNSADQTDCDYGPRNRASSEHPRSELLATTALSLVTRDPGSAYRLGLKSLPDGITSHVAELIKELSVKNKQLAEQLISACIERISSKDVNALEIHYVASFLFQDEISADRKQRAEAKVEERADLKAAFAKRLLEAALVATDRFVTKIETQQKGKAKADERVTDPGLQQVWTREADVMELAASYYSMMLNLQEGIRSYESDKLPETQALIERLGRWMNPLDREHMLVFYDNGDTPESLVAEAERTIDAGQKQELYELASELAQQKGDETKALALAAKIDDEEKRNYSIDGIWLSRAFQATNKQEFDEAHALIKMMTRPEGRLRALIELAQRIPPTSESQKKEAVALLDEAQTLVMTGSPSAQQARTMMELARVYAQADSELGFEVAAKAIYIVNTSDPPVADKTRWQFTPIMTSHDPLSIFGTDTRLFEMLAKIDFERTLQLARKFNDPALRVAAELSAVRITLPPR